MAPREQGRRPQGAFGSASYAAWASAGLRPCSHTRSHGVKLTAAQHSGPAGTPAVLQDGDEACMALLSFLEPKPPARL